MPNESSASRNGRASSQSGAPTETVQPLESRV